MPVSAARFAAEIILQSLFFLSLLTDRPLAKAVGAVSLLASVFVGTPSTELHSKVSWDVREFFTSLLWLLVIAAAAFVLRDYWGQAVLVIPLWLAAVVLACWRRFKGQRSSSNLSNP